MKRFAGFTLIELLLVILIMGTITALGIASYASYNSSQSVQSSAADVVTVLGSAKARAISQVVPSSCGTNSLTGYQVDITISGQQYTLSAICGSKQVLKTNNLPPQVSFGTGSTTSILFTVSSGTTNQSTIYVTGYGKTKTITINKTGFVSVQ